MNFPYRRYLATSPAGLATVYRPVIPVRLIGPGGDADLMAIVDTASDDTLLPRSVGEAIWLPFDQAGESRITGIGGHRLSAAYMDVELELSDGQQACCWKAQVGFVSFDDPEDEVSILGGEGCLEFFAALFHGEHRFLDLIPTGAFPGMVT